MRVIAGNIKGRLLHGPEVSDLSVRPTSDRAKEAIFSIMQRYNAVGPFLDLFAGTGAIATEAWSRGYCPVTCVEKQLSAITYIKKNARATGIEIVHNDINALSVNYFMNQAIIFADPPYEYSTKLWTSLASKVQNWLMQRNGILVWETRKGVTLANNKIFTLIETRCYGNNSFHIFKKI